MKEKQGGDGDRCGHGRERREMQPGRGLSEETVLAGGRRMGSEQDEEVGGDSCCLLIGAPGWFYLSE